MKLDKNFIIMIIIAVLIILSSSALVSANKSRRDYKKLKKQDTEKEIRYLEYINELQLRITILDQDITEIDDSIEILKERYDKEIDSLLSMSIDDKIKHLSNRFSLD